MGGGRKMTEYLEDLFADLEQRDRFGTSILCIYDKETGRQVTSILPVNWNKRNGTISGTDLDKNREATINLSDYLIRLVTD